MSTPRHFLTLNDLSSDELLSVLRRASELKQMQRDGTPHASLTGKVMAMIFAKASTRTRVSFEAGMTQLGGSAMFLSSSATQMGRGEPVEDTAKVISSMVDIVMIRTFDHQEVETFAANSSVPEESASASLKSALMSFSDRSRLSWRNAPRNSVNSSVPDLSWSFSRKTVSSASGVRD